MQRPIVLFDAGPFPGSTVGIGQVRLQYAKAVMANPKSSFDFRFLIHPRDEAMRATGVNLGKAHYSFSFFLRHLLNREKARFSRYYYTGQDHALRHITGHAFFRIPPTETAPLLYTLHDTHFFAGAEYHKTTAYNVKHVIACAQAVTFVSKYIQKRAQALIPLEGKLLQVIYNGVGAPATPHRPLWHKSARPFFLCLSQIIPHKNYHVLAPVMHQFPNYDLVIAGKKSNPYAKTIQQLFAKMGLAERVMMPGTVSESEKAWLYQNCTAFLCPSLREGFGLPIIEAFQMGKPVFCSRNTALVETGGKHAYFWDNYEPDYLINSLRTHLPTAMSNHTPKARQRWAQQFSWRHNFESHCALYGELLARQSACKSPYKNQ